MPPPKERAAIKVQAERAVLAAVRLPTSVFDERDPFGELTALAEQAGATVVGTLEQRLDRPVAGTYMGTGKVKELRALCDQLDAQVVIFDHELSPRQIASIEEQVERKIVDRSELILDIFAGRATTTEAQLQVELAQLEYTLPRLRAMWSHLERIVGSGGLAGIGTRGPGEQQLEIDRRLAQRRKLAMQRRLEEIQARKRRMVARRNLDHFTVGIVGYTNAGKSTLFNTLTAGGAYADDRLFATLTTRTREWDLGGGVHVMLSDTVGFVRALPHNLIASFKATLEEATHANLLLVVLDASDPAAEIHHRTVTQTLEELFTARAQDAARRGEEASGPETYDEDEDGGEAASGGRGAGATGPAGAGEEAGGPGRPPVILLLNKADKLRDNAALVAWRRRESEAITVVARDRGHPGMAELARRVRAMASGDVRERWLRVPLSEGRTVDTLEKRGEVVERRYGEGVVDLRVRVGRRQLDQLRALGSRFAELDDQGRARPLPRVRRGWGREGGATGGGEASGAGEPSENGAAD